MHDKDASEQPKTPEQPASAEEQRGFFTRAADKIGLGGLFNRMRGDQPEGHTERSDLRDSEQKARKIRDELKKQPKGIILDHIPEKSPFAVLNKLMALPVEHQMGALELVYQEAQTKQSADSYGHGRITDPDEIKERLDVYRNAHLIRTDRYAVSIEPDPARREAATRMMEQHYEAWKNAPGVEVEGKKQYQRLDVSMFTPEVAQSRETMFGGIARLGTANWSFPTNTASCIR